MKRFSLFISILILNIACIFDFLPKFKLYMQFKSIFQLGEVASQLSEIILLTALLAAILISSKRVFLLIFGVIICLCGNALHLRLDIYNSYFTYRNLIPRFSYVILFSVVLYLLICKEHASNTVKHIGFLVGLAGSGVVAFEKIRAGIFQANIYNIHVLYGVGMFLAVLSGWLIFSRKNSLIKLNTY